ncbi:hypothetical protein CBR65_01975 [Cellvibrio sp. PSBB006]|nr:hypothetical protein CBR65_01975 [Cellvibrio sp. PSBB006]
MSTQTDQSQMNTHTKSGYIDSVLQICLYSLYITYMFSAGARKWLQKPAWHSYNRLQFRGQ